MNIPISGCIIAYELKVQNEFKKWKDVGMTPGTALNLLEWLREHERLLQQLVDD